jgi:hypothetical protein
VTPPQATGRAASILDRLKYEAHRTGRPAAKIPKLRKEVGPGK